MNYSIKHKLEEYIRESAFLEQRPLNPDTENPLVTCECGMILWRQ